MRDILPHIRAGKGEPLVLVHGYLGGAEQWQSQINYFSQFFDVIAPNLPGFGSAMHLQGHDRIEDMADSVLQLLNDLEIKNFMLLGHSMGGMIVQNIAYKQASRIKKLVLNGTGSLGMMPNRFEPIAKSKERLAEEGVAKTIERIAATWFVDGAEHSGHKLLVDVGIKANHQAAMDGLDAMANWDGRDKLKELTMPTLILWSDEDKSYRWLQVEYLWENLPNCRLAVIPKASHAAQLEKPEIYLKLLEDFLL